MCVCVCVLARKRGREGDREGESLRVRTQRRSQQPVDDDVSVASDWRREVSVEGNIESVVFEELLILHLTAAEVQRHLESAGKTEPGYRPLQMFYETRH